jgi:hypothetical protein
MPLLGLNLRDTGTPPPCWLKSGGPFDKIVKLEKNQGSSTTEEQSFSLAHTALIRIAM